MSRSCTLCTRLDRPVIDAALSGGSEATRVAQAFGLSYDATLRHARNHLAPTFPQVPLEPLADGADPLHELASALRLRALAGDPVAAREYRLSIAAQAERGGLDQPAYDVLADPNWHRLRTAILEALRPYPAARVAVANAIAKLE